MKKLILLISIIGLFTLGSCDKSPDVDSSSLSQEPTTESEPVSTNDSSSSNTDFTNSNTEPTNTNQEPSNQPPSDSNNTSSPIGDYDDGGDWHGKID